MNLEAIIAQYGIWAVALGAGLEGETALVLGGIAVHRELIAYASTILAGAAGSFIADQSFFAIGRKFRDGPRIKRFRQKKGYARAVAAFERHPTLFVFAFRFLYGMRTVSPIAIGTTTLPARRFLVINALAALVWTAVFVSLGYVSGQAIEAAFGRVRSFAHVLIPVVVIAIGLGLAARALLRRRGTSK